MGWAITPSTEIGQAWSRDGRFLLYRRTRRPVPDQPVGEWSRRHADHTGDELDSRWDEV